MKFLKLRSPMQWARRIVQALSLGAFVWLVLAARLAEEGGRLHYLATYFMLDPLVALSVWLAARHWMHGILLALATVAVTLVFGRVFCGWFCPLGTVNQMATWFRARPKPGTPPQRRSPWQRLKYAVLVALILMALFGVNWVGVLDPFSILYRSVALVVFPATHFVVDDASTAIFQQDLKLGPVRATWFSEPVYEFFRDQVFVVGCQTFSGSAVVAGVFLLIVVLNLVRPRFWCRYVCPLGGMLGLLASRPLMRLRNDPATCNDCGKCNTVCPAAAQPDVRGDWLPTECFACWNCVAACNFNSISFEMGAPKLREPGHGNVDFPRRAALAALGAGVVGVAGMRLTPVAQAKKFNPGLIRPPGALPERAFLQRCVQCGICMRACPTNALHPATTQAGIEGLWTPVLVPSVGYCAYTCNQCGQACPTGAIEPLAIEEKQRVSIGLATFDRNRCLPWAYQRECLICEEHCPLAPKAIFFIETPVTRRDGTTVVLKQPHVDPDLCIGCGICENTCVFKDQPAVRVSSANESRNRANRPILPGTSAPPPAAAPASDAAPVQDAGGAPVEAPAPAAAPSLDADPYGLG